MPEISVTGKEAIIKQTVNKCIVKQSHIAIFGMDTKTKDAAYTASR